MENIVKPKGIVSSILYYLSQLTQFQSKIWLLLPMHTAKHMTILFYPLTVKWIIDDYIPEKNRLMIWCMVGVIIIASLVNVLLHRQFVGMVTWMSTQVSRTFRNQLISKLQILNLRFHEKQESGRSFSKIMIDVERTERFSDILFHGILGSITTFIVASGVLFYHSWKLFILYLILLPSYLIVYRFFKTRFKNFQHELRMTNENLSQSISSFIQTSKLARVHGEEEYEKKKVDRNNKEMIRKAVILQKSIASFTVIINTSSQVLLMVIIASCAMAIINDWMAVGTLVLFMAYINQVTNSIRSLIEQFPQITQFNESIHSIREILDYPAHDHNENAITMDAVKGDLSLKNVCFQYDQDRSVLENINLQVQKGETIALVGPSGSGKSTMINLILGLYLPVRGEITVDGYNLKKINLRQYRQSVGVVTQDPILFKGTLRENLCHGREFPDEQIIDASKLANAWEFIGLLPLGLDTIIGEDGVNLSGGQKQRIAITRAILRNPSILILDEATSALDSHSENEVQKGIEALIGRQTTFVIAHRLRTIYKADKILVFDKQGIAEEGNHSELIEMNGIYSEMVKLQSIQ